MGAADGLLERKVLLLTLRVAAGRRVILDPEGGTPVGCIRRRPRIGWRSRFARRVVEVQELEDDSLLCTVRRCWSFVAWYEVRDADEHLVGWHGGPLLLDRNGHRVAMREDETEVGTSRYVSPDGATLARLAWQGEDALLTFADEVADEPFVKMLLLAAALRW